MNRRAVVVPIEHEDTTSVFATEVDLDGGVTFDKTYVQPRAENTITLLDLWNAATLAKEFVDGGHLPEPFAKNMYDMIERVKGHIKDVQNKETGE